MASKRTLKTLEPLGFIFPGVAILLIFVYYPLIQNFINSFFRFSAFSPSKIYVGFDNFKMLFQDSVVLTAIRNNVRYAIVSVLIQVCFGLVLASILEDKAFSKVAVIFRTTFFLPVLISVTVVCLLFSFVYNPMDGLLNRFLELAGLGSLARPWLGDRKSTRLNSSH